MYCRAFISSYFKYLIYYYLEIKEASARMETKEHISFWEIHIQLSRHSEGIDPDFFELMIPGSSHVEWIGNQPNMHVQTRLDYHHLSAFFFQIRSSHDTLGVSLDMIKKNLCLILHQPGCASKQANKKWIHIASNSKTLFSVHLETGLCLPNLPYLLWHSDRILIMHNKYLIAWIANSRQY